MRLDLGKCVTERPRRNSSAASAKAIWYGRIHEDNEGQLDYDGLTRLPVSSKQEGYHKKIGGKSFTDVLAPIEGYLRSSVGRPWNEVYSELSRHLGRGSWPARHVLTEHVAVATKTYRGVDGKVYFHGRHGPDVVDGRHGSEFYVHPETGTLRNHPRKSRKYRSELRREDTDRVQAGEDRWYVKINSLWFLGTYRLRDEGATAWPNFPASRHGGAGVWVFLKIKSCSKNELRDMRSSKLHHK